MIDYSALKFNQIAIITLLIIAFLLNQSWLVGFVALVMLVSTWRPQAGLFKRIYQHWIKPQGWMTPLLIRDEQQPHLFAQGVGGIFLAASVIAFLLGSPFIGWLLVGIVVVLAAVNLFLGFCLGCYLYYQFARRGLRVSLPGWQQH